VEGRSHGKYDGNSGKGKSMDNWGSNQLELSPGRAASRRVKRRRRGTVDLLIFGYLL